MKPPEQQIIFHASMVNAWSAFSDEFISVWDEKTENLVYFNDAYTQFFGFDNKEEFVEQYVFLGFRKHPLSLDISDLVKDTIKRNGLWKEEVLLVKKNGEVYLGRLDIATFLLLAFTFSN